MNTQTTSSAVNLELTARVIAKGNQARNQANRKPAKKDKTPLIAVLVLAVIPAAVFGLQALGIIHLSSY